MATSKPPRDDASQPQGVLRRSEDAYIGRTKGDAKNTAEAAPEVSQGAWRERVFTPRGVMERHEVKAGLESALRAVLGAGVEQLVAAWLPFLRQAIEQAGGDGIDVWLLTLFSPPGRPAKQPLFVELAEAMRGLHQASTLAAREAQALQTIERIDAVLGTSPVKLSFKQMEKQLEGKLEVDELLTIFSGTDEVLARRSAELAGTMEQLREEIRTLPGKQPDGMYSNFVRLKTELRVLEAERLRRVGTRPTFL